MSKLANEFHTIVDDLGGSIERRFMAREAPHVPALTPTERLAMQRHVSHGREDGNGAGPSAYSKRL
jgi:hypothetical protein